jgi:ABC-type glycerol-3-phosphate transport system permease component
MRRRVLIALGAVLVLTWSLAPVAWLVIASISPEQAAQPGQTWSSARAVQYFPDHPGLQNYVQLFANVPFAAYIRNSAIVASCTALLALTVACLGAFGFVRFRFRFRGPLLVTVLTAYVIPSVVLLVPLMVIFRQYGLINTYAGLVLAESTNTAPFALLLMINTFAQLPRDLEEAALVDGCSRLGTLWRILLPLAVPGLVAAGAFAFIMTWNNFLYAYIFTTTDSTKTLPVIMRLFALGEPAVWGVSAAGGVLTALPVAALFLLLQRTIIGGLAAGAVKG